MIYNLLDLFGLTKIISAFAKTWVSYLTTPTGISIIPTQLAANLTISNSTAKTNSTKRLVQFIYYNNYIYLFWVLGFWGFGVYNAESIFWFL